MIKVTVEGPKGAELMAIRILVEKTLKEQSLRVRFVPEHEAPLIDRETVDVVVIQKVSAD